MSLRLLSSSNQYCTVPAQVGSIIDQASGSAFSLSCWVKLATSRIHPIVGGENVVESDRTGFNIAFRAAGLLRITNRTNVDDLVWDTTLTFPTQLWHHIAVILVVGATPIVYVNGQAVPLNNAQAWIDPGDVLSGYGVGRMLVSGVPSTTNMDGWLEDYTFFGRALGAADVAGMYQDHASGLSLSDVLFHYPLDARSGAVIAGQPAIRDSISQNWSLGPVNAPLWGGSTPFVSYPRKSHVIPGQLAGSGLLVGKRTTFVVYGADEKYPLDGTRRLGQRAGYLWTEGLLESHARTFKRYDTHFDSRAQIYADYDVPFDLRGNRTFELDLDVRYKIGSRYCSSFESHAIIYADQDVPFDLPYRSDVGAFVQEFDVRATVGMYLLTLEVGRYITYEDYRDGGPARPGPGMTSHFKTYNSAQWEDLPGGPDQYHAVFDIIRGGFEWNTYEADFDVRSSCNVLFDCAMDGRHRVRGPCTIRIYRNDGTEDGPVDYGTVYKEIVEAVGGQPIETDALAYPAVWRFGLRRYNGFLEELNATQQRRLELDANGQAVEDAPPAPAGVAIRQIAPDPSPFFVKVRVQIEIIAQDGLPVPTHVELRRRLMAGYLPGTIELPVTLSLGRGRVDYTIESPYSWFQHGLYMAVGARAFYAGVSGNVYSLPTDSPYIIPELDSPLPPRQVVLRAL